MAGVIDSITGAVKSVVSKVTGHKRAKSTGRVKAAAGAAKKSATRSKAGTSGSGPAVRKAAGEAHKSAAE